MVINLYDKLYFNLPENTLGQRLKKARLKLRLSQEELALKCDLNRTAIDRYEKDWIYPSRNSLVKLITIINKDYLCCDEYSKFILSNYISLLKDLRLKNKLSIREMSKLLNIPSSTYVSIEKGIYLISKKNYIKIKDNLKRLIT